MGDETSVRVALRIRPQLAQERIDLCRVCTSVTPGEPQVVMGKDRAFTYDHVFDTETIQETIYDQCIDELVEGCFDGFNATVLAYGQTGSGKTFTMGTGFDVCAPAKEQGIIPRAVAHLFNGIQKRMSEGHASNRPTFQVAAQFLELYNEEIYDLFSPTRDTSKKSNIKIHEDPSHGIYAVGVTSCPVTSMEETMDALRKGALSRTTASTCMNAQSSRSHAIFTLFIKQSRVAKCDNDDVPEADVDFENLTSKFHFVDLAGSERLKRTGATGDRAKEGISINCGLLALGNVISALGDETRRASHVPYRDSKLTRLLQDSLGGNSRTLMIACISPSDRDFMETLNTLKYANRARNIKNKVVVNQDKSSQVIGQLRQEIQRLTIEINEFRQGKRIVGEDGKDSINDLFHENALLKAESDKLRLRLKAAQRTIDEQGERLAETESRLAVMAIGEGSTEDGEETSPIQTMIKGYLQQIEELKSELIQSETLARNEPHSPFRRLTNERLNLSAIKQARASTSPTMMSLDSAMTSAGRQGGSFDNLLQEAKEEITRAKTRVSGKRHRRKSDGDKEEEEEEEEEESGEDESGSSLEDDLSESGSSDDELARTFTESDLAQLSNEISIKQRLVDQLEFSKKELDTMKEHYEDKLLLLQEKVRRTEKERDTVLHNINTNENATEDVVKSVRSEYKTKLESLQKEIKKLKTAKREHQSLLKAKAQNEQQLRVMKNDLQEMKKQKVQLIRKLREEANFNKEKEAKRNREIAQLRKEQRKQEFKIKNMASAERKREQVLKRRAEQIAHLRKQVRPSSARPASQSGTGTNRVAPLTKQISTDDVKTKRLGGALRKPSRERKPSSLFSSVSGKRKWGIVEDVISAAVLQKQTIANMERDMDRWIQEREKLGKEISELTSSRSEAVEIGRDETFILDVEDELETLKLNLQFAEENIQERESDIMGLMDAKEDDGLAKATAVLHRCGINEAKYFMEHFLNKTVNQGVELSECQWENRRLKEMLKATEEEGRAKGELLVQQTAQWDSELMQSEAKAMSSLLHHLIKPKDVEKRDEPPRAMNETFDIRRSGSGSSNETQDSNSSDSATEAHRQKLISIISPKTKARRRMATPMELLYPTHGIQGNVVSQEDVEIEIDGSIKKDDVMPPPKEEETKKKKPDDVIEVMPPPSKIPTRFRGDEKKRGAVEVPSPGAMRKTTESGVPPVFQRLSAPVEPGISPLQNPGNVIKMNDGKVGTPSALTPVYSLEGHSSAVMALATIRGGGSCEWICTGSQDSSVRVWDLGAEKEVMTFSQLNSVAKLAYCSESGLLFSASQAAIKVWDLRLENKCVKTMGPNSSDRLWRGGGNIQDIVIDQSGSNLYCAANGTSNVKIWDLNKFAISGKLLGHSAAVVTLLLNETESERKWLYTGSRDHYVRIFDLKISSNPLHTLEPPHYDGVQSIARCGQFLLSGSRDFVIKNWNLDRFQLQGSICPAHTSWITAMQHVPGTELVASGCRSGVVKLWSLAGGQSLAPVGEVVAHQYSVNCMGTWGGGGGSPSLLLTGSSDKKVMIWRVS